MSNPTGSPEFYAFARTAPARAQAISTQSWKSRAAGTATADLGGNTGFQAHLQQTGEQPRTAARPVNIARSFHDDLAKGASQGGNRADSFEAALSLSEPTQTTRPPSSEFSFDDVIDIVNPLHHLPVVGMIYREISGDTIKPMAQIIGGGIFGGPVGAVSGTINAVVQEETGKDIAGNVMALVMGDDDVAVPALPDDAPAAIDRNNPEMALSLASAQYGNDEYVAYAQAEAQAVMPNTAMGFAAKKATHAYAKHTIAEGRTAGWTARQAEAPAIDVDFAAAEITADNLPPREAITVLPMNAPVYGGIY